MESTTEVILGALRFQYVTVSAPRSPRFYHGSRTIARFRSTFIVSPPPVPPSNFWQNPHIFLAQVSMLALMVSFVPFRIGCHPGGGLSDQT